MHSVSRESLLNEFNFAENANDKATGTQEEIHGIVNDVFDSLRWTSVQENVVQGVSALNEWKHRSLNEIEADWSRLEINRRTLQSALDRYLDLGSIRSKNLDWLFINVLTYAEYIATLDEIRRSLLGIEEFIKHKCNAAPRAHSINIAPLLNRWWHWPLAITLFSLSFFLAPFGPIAFAAYIAWAVYKRSKLIKKINRTLESMLQTYQSINTASLGWQNVQKSLDASKEKGAVWDASVFSLVESRINQQVASMQQSRIEGV